MKTTLSGRVIIASKTGRLGNRLFLSAYFMANALSKGYQLFNPALGEYSALFEGSTHDPFCAFPPSSYALDEGFASQCREVFISLAAGLGFLAGNFGLPGVRLLDIRNSHDSKDRSYNLSGEDFTEVLISSPVLLVKGWKFRDGINLVRFHSEIRSYFTPVASVRLPAERVIEEARSRADLVIGVHIRQGDYRGWKNGIHYFETTQYAHWMRQAKALFPEKKIVFMICASNPIETAELREFDVVYGPGAVASDLHALSLCDRIIAPPSTFSTWASYYGRVPLSMMEHHEQQLMSESFALHDGV